jgi:hypothetical protein
MYAMLRPSRISSNPVQQPAVEVILLSLSQKVLVSILAAVSKVDWIWDHCTWVSKNAVYSV